MKIITFFVGCILISNVLFSQVLDKNDQILVNKLPIAKLLKIKAKGAAGIVNDFDITSLDGKNILLSFRWSEGLPSEDNMVTPYVLKSYEPLDSCVVYLNAMILAKSAAKLVGKHQ